MRFPRTTDRVFGPYGVEIVGALAEEQTWSNFKNEVAEFGGRDAYEKALHDVWETMYLLQLREKA